MLKLRFAIAERPRASLVLCISVSLLLVIWVSCTLPTKTVEDPPSNVSTDETEAPIKQSWNGDYPVASLASLPEKADHHGTGYIADPLTFSSIWSAFKPNEQTPEIDFKNNLVIFVRNIQYYNHIMIGKVVLKNGVAEVIAMETLSARPIEDVVAISMAVISRDGVEGIQTRGGVIQVTK